MIEPVDWYVDTLSKQINITLTILWCICIEIGCICVLILQFTENRMHSREWNSHLIWFQKHTDHSCLSRLFHWKRKFHANFLLIYISVSLFFVGISIRTYAIIINFIANLVGVFDINDYHHLATFAGCPFFLIKYAMNFDVWWSCLSWFSSDFFVFRVSIIKWMRVYRGICARF